MDGGGRRAVAGGHGLARHADDRDRGADGGGLPVADEDLEQRPVGLGLVGHRRLVGLDLGDRVAAGHAGADRDEPGDDGPLLHRVGQAGHENFGRHEPWSPSGGETVQQQYTLTPGIGKHCQCSLTICGASV